MKPIGQLDTSHAMYQRGNKRGLGAYERRAIELALRQTAIAQAGGIVPDPHGSQAQREAWMRERQHEAQVGARRERQMLAEAEAYLTQKRAVCQCNIEQIKARLRSDPGLRDMLRRGLEEC